MIQAGQNFSGLKYFIDRTASHFSIQMAPQKISFERPKHGYLLSVLPPLSADFAEALVESADLVAEVAAAAALTFAGADDGEGVVVVVVFADAAVVVAAAVPLADDDVTGVTA